MAAGGSGTPFGRLNASSGRQASTQPLRAPQQYARPRPAHRPAHPQQDEQAHDESDHARCKHAPLPAIHLGLMVGCGQWGGSEAWPQQHQAAAVAVIDWRQIMAHTRIEGQTASASQPSPLPPTLAAVPATMGARKPPMLWAMFHMPLQGRPGRPRQLMHLRWRGPRRQLTLRLSSCSAAAQALSPVRAALFGREP